MWRRSRPRFTSRGGAGRRAAATRPRLRGGAVGVPGGGDRWADLLRHDELEPGPARIGGASFAIWDGGLGIWGGITAGVLVGLWRLRSAGANIPLFMDAGAPALLVAQAIGRIGNYFNQELFGGAALVLAATDETLLPASDAGGGHRPPVDAAVGAVARLAARHPAGEPAAARPTRSPAIAPLAVELSLVQARTENSRHPSYSTDNGVSSRRPRTPRASSSSRPGWCSRAASAAGWPATCPGPGSTTCCCAMSSPPRTSACCTSCSRSTGRAPPARGTPPATPTARPTRLRRPEVPGPVRLRVPPALAGA